jgi:prephenate dehydrogenase
VSLGVPLGIAGVGLIGGSIALRARERGIQVIGYDRARTDVIDRILDQSVESLDELANRSRTLVLALPVDATVSAIRMLRGKSFGDLRLVVDVASVKSPIVREAAGWSAFVATHPIAGAEQSGPGAARGDLFAGRTWTYVPTAPALELLVREFIEAMGARPFPIDADAHDRALAMTSHLPQVVVATLGAMLEERGIPSELAGPGLISTLRLAGSPWDLWETILRANESALAPALRDLGTRLCGLADDLKAGDTRRAASYFRGANAAYETFCKMDENK